MSLDEKQILKKLDRLLTKSEKQTVAIFRQALKEIREEIALTYERYAKGGKLTQEIMNKYNRLGKLEAKVVKRLNKALSKNERTLQTAETAIFTQAYYSRWLFTNEEIGVVIDFKLLNPERIQGVLDNPLKDIAQKRLRFLGREKIRRAIKKGVIRGEGYPEMAREIRKAIKGTANDALRIARTEGGRAQTLGQKTQIEEALKEGVKLKVRWDATLDSRTRPDHQVMDGRYAVIHEDGTYHFDTPVGPVAGPRLSGDAGFDINCRCRITEEDLEPPETRRAGDKGEREVIKYKTYREWAEKEGAYDRHNISKDWRE